MAVLALVAGGCSTNPATGESVFTLFMQPADEVRVGAQEHPKILERFGGVYDNSDVGGYVAEIGGRLVANSEMPSFPFTFTVLNSPDVNAFALPGGYVYVTRGLLALANSEAELAGVIGHEIGHVVARHTAQRYSQAVAAGLGAALLGAAVGGDAEQLAQLGSELYLASFSRDQEYQADQLGVRYLRNAGYAPGAMAGFLENLARNKALQEKLLDQDLPEADFFATHPNTPDRVARAAALAAGSPGATRQDELFAAISGLVYGDDPAQGLVRGRRFSHPDLGITFEAPPGFRLVNTEQAVYARQKNAAVVRFDAARRDESHPDPLVYLTQIWAPDLRLREAERIVVNGLPAATASAQLSGKLDDYRGSLDARFVVVQFPGNKLYRLLFLSQPARAAALREDFQRMTFSLRPLTQREASDLVPLTVEILQVPVGASIESLAAGLPFTDWKADRFRVLNGFDPGEEPLPGQKVKVIAE
ncbi:MAG: M48 family metalloprotease [Alphaproteobacteria bacterium]